MGSFFEDHSGNGDARPTCGSFELNPPFSAELYDALLARCIKLLELAEASETALSYTMIIGATEAALRLRCITELQRSRFFRGRMVVGVESHVYVCGRQHMKQAAATFRACDTGVFFLQTTMASAKWPVTKAKLAQLRAAFEVTNSK